MSSPTLIEHVGDGGYFEVFFTPPGGRRTNVTLFRGAPTRINTLTSTDPFGDASGSLLFPQITTFDRLGSGDLSWCVPWANVDIEYRNADGTFSGWVWEGLFASEDPTAEGLQVTLLGALYQADNHQAAPWFPQYPIPYELLIRETLSPSKNPSLRTAPVQVVFPDNWNVTVPVFDRPDYLWFLKPYGVSPGQKWTGLTTRQTGGWEPKLTGLVQTLLSVMYTEDGQWTLTKNPGRVPVLRVRSHMPQPDDQTYYVYNGAPGVTVNLSRDFTQSANVIYGSGVDLSGSTFSGQFVSKDGQATAYEPFAYLPYVHPAVGSNERLNPHIVRKETRLQFPQGMDELSARDVAAAHLRRFADPGYTGSIDLTTDPMVNGRVKSRFLVKAGEQIVVRNYRGFDLLLHVTEVTASPHDGNVSMTVDTKFRDALTVAEVRARTRDALDPVRLLQVGKFSTTVQDQILPWSYTQGSGVIPSGGDHDATEFFTKHLSPTARFPWTDFTKKYPPKKYPKYYIKVGPDSSNADRNWGGMGSDNIARGIPVRMAQNGTIRLIQVALYDENGNVKPARFHISFYNNSGVTHFDMPRIPDANTPGAGRYKQSMHYPFFQGAFERVNPDGTEVDDPSPILHESAGLVIGWGNYYEEAGYWPGRYSAGGPKTGMLVDESTWSFDTTMDPDFDKYSVERTRAANTTGLLYAMVYVDYHGTKPVYLMGRCFRQEST